MGNSNTTKVTKSPLQAFEEFYANKHFAEARDVLLQNKQHFSSGIFHYNLGTTYAKLGDFGAARFNLEKAIHEGFNNTKSKNNLNYVVEQLKIEDLSTSDSLTDRSMNLMLSISQDAFLGTGLFLSVLVLVIAIMKKMKWKTSVALVIIALSVPLVLGKLIDSNIHYAIALKDIEMFEGPSKIFQQKGSLKAGAKVIIEENKEGWIFIKYPENLAGWVRKDYLGIF